MLLSPMPGDVQDIVGAIHPCSGKTFTDRESVSADRSRRVRCHVVHQRRTEHAYHIKQAKILVQDGGETPEAAWMVSWTLWKSPALSMVYPSTFPCVVVYRQYAFCSCSSMARLQLSGLARAWEETVPLFRTAHRTLAFVSSIANILSLQNAIRCTAYGIAMGLGGIGEKGRGGSASVGKDLGILVWTIDVGAEERVL